jgi:hypothetical protein
MVVGEANETRNLLRWDCVMTQNGDTPPHGSRNPFPPASDNSPPGGMKLDDDVHEEIAKAVGFGRRLDNVEKAVLQVGVNSSEQYDALAASVQAVHDTTSEQGKHLASIDESIGGIARDLASLVRSASEARTTNSNETEMAKARADSAVIVAESAERTAKAAESTAVVVKKAASGWRIAWTVALLVGGVTGGAFKEQIIAALSRLLGAHP